VNEPRVDTGTTEAQRRRIRRMTIVLAIVAVGIYLAFILSGVLKSDA
jgi:hypothetical protein